MVRAPCCEKVGLKRGRWTAEEDKILTNYILVNGEGSWRSLPKNAGLLRCGKSCRLRWINYLRAGLKRGNITKEEEELIVKLHSALGNRWSLIAAQLPGRTDNEIKNYWNSHLSRKIYTYMRSKRFSNNNVAAAPPSSHSHTLINMANLNNKNQAASVINHLQSNLKNRSLLMSNKCSTVANSGSTSIGLVSKEPLPKHQNIPSNKNINPNQWCPVNNYERKEIECSNMGPYEWLDSEVTRLKFILQSEDNNNGDGVIMINDNGSDSVAQIEYSTDNKSCEKSTDQGGVDWSSYCCSPPIKSRFDDTVLDWDWTRNEEEESQWDIWNISERNNNYAYVM